MNHPIESRWIAFDIEISTIIPEGQDWREMGPIEVSCVATVDERGRRMTYVPPMSGTAYAMALPMYTLSRVLSDLDLEMRRFDRVPVSWNGAGFDLPILAAGAGMATIASKIALEHIDVGFQMLCENGYMAGLNAVCGGMGIPGKLNGMHGELAPAMWRSKDIEQQCKVISYLENDALITSHVFEAICKAKKVRWKTQKGTFREWLLKMKDGCPLTVQDSLAIPLPDTSWMSRPRPRSEYIGWAQPKTLVKEVTMNGPKPGEPEPDSGADSPSTMPEDGCNG